MKNYNLKHFCLLICFNICTCKFWLVKTYDETGVIGGKKNNGTKHKYGSGLELKAESEIEDYSIKKIKLMESSYQAQWNYYTGISNKTQVAMNKAKEIMAAFDKKSWKKIFTKYDYKKFKNKKLKRRFQLQSTLGLASLGAKDFSHFTMLESVMKRIHSEARICPFDNKSCNPKTEGLEEKPGVDGIFKDTKNRSWEELLYFWTAWRNATGRKLRDKIEDYLTLNNKAAKLNGFPDMGSLWLNSYTADLEDDEDFRDDLESLLLEILPLYRKLHAYVRWRYRKHWGEEKMPDPSAPIPAHIFGDKFAQIWHNTIDMVSPFSDEPSLFSEVDANLKEQNYTIRDMYELSNSFFTSLGLADMKMCYETPCTTEDSEENRKCVRKYPMIEKPSWNMACRASAWDMMKPSNNDFRILMCTQVRLQDLITVHHEMGHIQYYIQYKDKLLQFRRGANDGFHEAIGDSLALAVSTPTHLEKLKLLKSAADSEKAELNFLLTAALERFAFLPFAYTIDQYRWGLFNKSIPVNKMNEGWWKLRKRYQGIAPPIQRTEDDFDAGAKSHVAFGIRYIRYFVARILQYQFYKQMCLDSGNYDQKDPAKPLHKCDFSQGHLSTLAGKRLKKLLAAGSSRPWPDLLEEMTGSRKMSAKAILEYFDPLDKWLQQQIEENDIPVGWN